MKQLFPFLWNITEGSKRASLYFYEARAKEFGFIKIQFVFFHKIYYNKMYHLFVILFAFSCQLIKEWLLTAFLISDHK